MPAGGAAWLGNSPQLVGRGGQAALPALRGRRVSPVHPKVEWEGRQTDLHVRLSGR